MQAHPGENFLSAQINLDVSDLSSQFKFNQNSIWKVNAIEFGNAHTEKTQPYGLSLFC